MHTHFSKIAILGAILLAACGGASAPAPTAQPLATAQPAAATKPAATAAPAPTATSLKLFNSPEGKFSVWLPGDPKVDSQTVDAAGMKIKVTMYTISSGTGAYIAGFNDYPAEMMKGTDLQNLLDGARDGGLKNINATLVNETKIDKDGFPGRDITAKANAQGKDYNMRMRVYIVNNRLYQTMALYEPGKMSDADIAQFLNSFTLMK